MKISICKTMKNFDQLLDSSCRLAIFGGWGEGTKKVRGERWEAESSSSLLQSSTTRPPTPLLP